MSIKCFNANGSEATLVALYSWIISAHIKGLFIYNLVEIRHSSDFDRIGTKWNATRPKQWDNGDNERNLSFSSAW